MIGSTSEGWKLAVNAVIAQCGLRTDAEGDAQHLIARPHAFEQVINRDDIGQHHNKARGTGIRQAEFSADEMHRLAAIALEQITNGECARQHNADVTGNLDSAE